MTRKSTVMLLDPTFEDVPDEFPVAPRLSSLAGATVALLDNTKHNSDRFLAALADELVRGYGVSMVVAQRKANANTPAPASLLDDISARADAVVHAVAD